MGKKEEIKKEEFLSLDQRRAAYVVAIKELSKKFKLSLKPTAYLREREDGSLAIYADILLVDNEEREADKNTN